jgi:hypothetical protein
MAAMAPDNTSTLFIGRRSDSGEGEASHQDCFSVDSTLGFRIASCPSGNSHLRLSGGSAVSFKQLCTYERCTGHWAIHVERGVYGQVALDGLNALVVFDSPQQMYAGGWTEALYLDDRAEPGQEEALETILSGRAGGPWAVLARFVGTWLETRRVPIRVEDEGRRKRMRVEEIFETTVEALKGVDPERDVLLTNLFNQIHGPVHVLARGSTKVRDRGLAFEIQGTHGLYSRFSWKGP